MRKTNKIKTYFLCSIIVLIGFFLCFFPKNISQGAKSGIINCINILVPSLFAFTVFTIFVTHSGLINKIFYYPAKILSKILNIDVGYSSIFLLGLIGGYHSSAKSISMLCKKGAVSKTNASYLISSSTNAGPAFLISAVGTSMFLSKEVGVILYVSGVLSSLTLFVIYSNKLRGKVGYINNYYDIPTSLVLSVKDACSTMCTLCAFVTLFTVVLSPIKNMDFSSNIFKSLLCGLIEVTSGCLLSSKEISLLSILTASIISSFGGLCVLMQIFVICTEAKIKLRNYFFSRILHMIFSSIYTFLLLLIFPIQTNKTFMSNTPSTSLSFQAAPLPAVLLLICCFTLPIYLSKQKNL